MAFTISTDRPGGSGSSSSTVVFRDGLGERRLLSDPARGGNVELLCIRQELNDVSSFEFALRERANRLATFRHAYFSPVRGVERVNEPKDTLAVVSDVTPGIRLSELLASLEERHVTLDITAALCLIRQIVPAVAMLHESARDIAHGAIAPERLIVTPNARLVLVDYVLASALEQLRYSHERYWAELRVALPKTGSAPRFDHRADVMQIGLVALSLILGRALRREEFPTRVRELVASAWSASGSGGGFEPLPPGLCAWLGRTLQLEALTAFPSAIEARAELDKILGDGHSASPAGLQTVLARHQGSERARAPAIETSSAPSAGVSVLDVPAHSRAATAPTRAVAPAREVAPVSLPRPDGAPKSSMLSALDSEPLPDPMGVEHAISIPDLPPAPSRAPVVLPSFPQEAKPKSPRLAVLDLKPLAEPIGAERAVDLTQLSLAAPVSSRGAESIALPTLETAEVSEVPKLGALDRKKLAAPLGVQPAAERTIGPTPSAHARPTGQFGLRSTSSETDGDQGLDIPKSRGFRLWKWVGGAAIVLPALVGGGAMTAKRLSPKPAIISTGTLVITTNPSGAQAVIDGEPRGTTPLNVELPAGPHRLELLGVGAPRTVPIIITAGMQVAQYLDLPPEAGAPGSLPAEPPPSRPEVNQEAAKQVDPPASNATAPVAAPAAPQASGWIAVSGPLAVQMFEKGTRLGSGQDRISLAIGKHEIDLVNDDLGYRASRAIDVQAGKTVTVKLDVPKAGVALNALPWAEVWIDGEKVGETPIGNLSLPLGTHELVFRHPDLGERRQTVVVGLKNPVRVSVDLRRP